MSEQTRVALRAARKCIRTDRAALYACHFNYALGRVDDDGQIGQIKAIARAIERALTQEQA